MRARAVICVGVACFVVWIAVSLPPGRCDDGYRRSRSNPAAIQRQGFGPPPWGESGAQAVRADTEVCGADVRRRRSSARLGAEKLMRGSTSGVLMAKGGRTTGATLGELAAHRFDDIDGAQDPAVAFDDCGATTRDAAPEAAFVVADGSGSYLRTSWSGRSPACKFPRGRARQAHAARSELGISGDCASRGLISAPRCCFIRRNFVGTAKIERPSQGVDLGCRCLMLGMSFGGRRMGPS
jgi:hypothetical protein